MGELTSRQLVPVTFPAGVECQSLLNTVMNLEFGNKLPVSLPADLLSVCQKRAFLSESFYFITGKFNINSEVQRY
jgi:hypothetical protein